MNKLSIALAALSIMTAGQAFANFEAGRVDTIVTCTSGTVNPLTVTVTNVEGTSGDVLRVHTK
jgi:hypothetical protein